MTPITARTFARHRPGRGTWTTVSPYSGNRVRVVAGTEHGNKVELRLAGDGTMEVDATHRIVRRDEDD
jgi:hypothetical protein